MRRFEIRTQDPRWLKQMHLIAEFCERVGIEADYAQESLTLHLIIHPEKPRCVCSPRTAKLPYN